MRQAPQSKLHPIVLNICCLIYRNLPPTRFFALKRLLHFWGTEVGFVIYDTISIKVDYLTIKQEHDAINVLPNTTVLKKENLGSNINSELEDLAPVISPDGLCRRCLVFYSK